MRKFSKQNAIFTPDSTATLRVNYAVNLKILEVEFVGGKVYRYFDVEPEKWEELKSIIEEGGSSGTFINIYIKPFYEAEEIIK